MATADATYATVSDPLPPGAGVSPEHFDGAFWTDEDGRHTDGGLNQLRATLNAGNEFLTDMGAAAGCSRPGQGAGRWMGGGRYRR